MSRTTTSPRTRTRTRTRLLGAVIAVVVLGLATLGVAAPASAAPVGTGANQEIRNAHSSMCLDDYQFNTQAGAEVRQWACHEGANQLWEVRDLGNGYAEIKNRYSNLCLDDYQFNTTPGAEVRQWPCWGGDVQQWQITDVGGGQSEIKNRYSNLCLEDKDASQVDGALIQQSTCNGSKIQRWRLSDPSVERITYTLARSQNPSPDELDAYARITDAMDRAVARYNRLNNIYRHLWVSYVPGVQTADATISGNIRFGADRRYMQEGTALHEMSHTVGVGTSWAFNNKCANNGWNSALSLLRSWEGPNAGINCGGGHMWPYGLNYANEENELNFERHTKLVQAMLSDGM